MAFDDDKFGTLFPTRTGGAIGTAGERLMLDALGGSQGFRTRIQTNPDGSTTVLRTKNGMPQFETTKYSQPQITIPKYVFQGFPISAGATFGYERSTGGLVSASIASLETSKVWLRHDQKEVTAFGEKTGDMNVGNCNWFDSRPGAGKLKKQVVTWQGINTNSRHAATIYRQEEHLQNYFEPDVEGDFPISGRLPYDDAETGPVSGKIFVDGEIKGEVPASYRILGAALDDSLQLVAIVCSAPAFARVYFGKNYYRVNQMFVIKMVGDSALFPGWTVIGQVYLECVILQAPAINSSATKGLGIINLLPGSNPQADYMLEVDLVTGVIAATNKATSQSTNMAVEATWDDHNGVITNFSANGFSISTIIEECILAVDYVGDVANEMTFKQVRRLLSKSPQTRYTSTVGPIDCSSEVAAYQDWQHNEPSMVSDTTFTLASGGDGYYSISPYGGGGAIKTSTPPVTTSETILGLPRGSYNTTEVTLSTTLGGTLHTYTRFDGIWYSATTQTVTMSSEWLPDLAFGHLGAPVNALQLTWTSTVSNDGTGFPLGNYVFGKQVDLQSCDLRTGLVIYTETAVSNEPVAVFDLQSAGFEQGANVGVTLPDGDISTIHIHRHDPTYPLPIFPGVSFVTSYPDGQHAVFSTPSECCKYIHAGGIVDLTPLLPNIGGFPGITTPIFFRCK